MKPAINVIVDRNIESYREWSKRRLKAEQDAGTVKTTLFHFTSYAGLRGILDNSNIRLTHYSFQNDPTEFVRGTRIATDCITDVAAAADFGPIHDLSACIGDLLGNPENMDFWTSYVGASPTTSTTLGNGGPTARTARAARSASPGSCSRPTVTTCNRSRSASSSGG